jgi:RNA polymerase sigma-70 factor, ECF subfamily
MDLSSQSFACLPGCSGSEDDMNLLNQSNPDNEAILIADAVKGDLDAFNQLVMKYQNMAYGHAYALVGDLDAADDIRQESFLKVFKNLVQFRGGSFRAWFMRIVTNTSYDLLRGLNKHPTQPLFPVDEYGEELESISWIADPEASVETTFDRRETSKRLLRALDELPTNYRSVLTLVDLYELDYSEAMQILNIPIGTVKSRLARARLQMQTKMKDDDTALSKATYAIAV